MGMKSKPRLREEKKETKEARLEKEATAEEKEERITVKKWKGKEWFNILAPSDLGARLIGQTPTTDPKSITGRTINVSVAEITGDNKKHHMRVALRINKIEGKTCLTSFNGFECAREHLMRMIRKRNQKVESVFNTNTKDGWFLKTKFLVILNGNTTTTIQKRVRGFINKQIMDLTRNSNMRDFLKKIISTEVQMRIKKEGSKIYPIRFSEVARIKVLRSPEFKPPEPKPEAKKPEEKKKEVKKEEKPEIEKPKEEPKEEKPEIKERKRPVEKPKEEAKPEKKEVKPKKETKAKKKETKKKPEKKTKTKKK